jgi:hypothetical protein
LFEAQPDGESEYLPLYEAKCIHQFDHRYASQNGPDFCEVASDRKQDPDCRMVPRSWVLCPEVKKRLAKRVYRSNWMCGFRSVSSPTNERTSIVSVFPLSAVGNSINLMLGLSASEALLLTANANSLCFDFTCRQKMSGMNLNIWIMKQLPAIPLSTYNQPAACTGAPLKDWVAKRALELVYTAWDVRPFAEDLGHSGPPYRWDDDRRFLIRCELDALYFRLYGLSRDEADCILDTFPIVRRKDEHQFGEYRTKRMILEIYDAMAEAERTGVPYQTRLDPPPADPRVAHSPSTAGSVPVQRS